MSETPPNESWLLYFRRTLPFLRPHRRPLFIGLAMAIGVSVFYTFSISSVVPLLKVMFSDHETLADWLYRVEAEHRLGVRLIPDLPDDPHGLTIDRVRTDSPCADLLHDGDRILAVADDAPGSYALMRRLAEHPDETVSPVLVASGDAPPTQIQLTLRPYRSWWAVAEKVVATLPGGKDPASRLYTLAIVMAALVIVSLLGSLCRFANAGLVAAAVQRTMHDLRTGLADHVLRLPLHWHTAQAPGDTLGRFANDLTKVEIGLWTLLGKTIREPLKAVGVLALTVAIDWRLLVVAVVGIPIGALVIRTFGRMVKRAQRRASQSWGRLLDHLGERLAGIRVVKAYSMEAGESRRFEREGRTLTHAQTHIELVDAATKPSLETLAMIAVAAFVVYGGSRVFLGQLEPHLFFAAVVCLAGIFDPVRKMGNVNNRLQAADVAARRVFELLDLRTEEPTPAASDGKTLPHFEQTIEFRDLAFAYPTNPDRNVLDGINLTVRHGQVVALVGPNGSGKTTLMSLLMRFYEPTRGQILIDGQDVANATLESLRAQIGLVTQDAVVFSDTLHDNIAYGTTNGSPETVRQAARLARVDEFAHELHATADGYDTPISARTLSGGQRQRIALARAILRDPPILILDEATSQVDSESERKIQEALEEATRGRTTFIIAHRFSTIAHADLIVVLNQGRIIATGRHKDLLDSCPFYVALCETQFAHTP